MLTFLRLIDDFAGGVTAEKEPTPLPLPELAKAATGGGRERPSAGRAAKNIG